MRIALTITPPLQRRRTSKRAANYAAHYAMFKTPLQATQVSESYDIGVYDHHNDPYENKEAM